MSLFDKMKKHQPPEKPNDGEFKSDVNTILHGTSVQNRKEMCELEYMKARRLLKNPTVETVARAKNIMNTLATDFDYLPAVLWMAEFSVNGVKNPEQAASFVLGEYYAKTGNREGAVKAYEKAVKGGYKDAEKKLAKLKKKF